MFFLPLLYVSQLSSDQKPLIEVPVPLPPQPQPTPKRRRVPITIVEYPSQTQTSSPTLASDIKINPEKGPKSEQLTPVSNGTHKSKPETTPSPKPPLSTPTTVASSYVPTDAPGQTQISQPRGGIFRPSGKHTLFPLADNTKTQPTPPSQPPLLSTHSHQQSQRFSPTQPATHIPTSPPPLVSIPVRNQELNAIRRTWHTLPNPEAQWNSFKVRISFPMLLYGDRNRITSWSPFSRSFLLMLSQPSSNNLSIPNY